MKSFLSQYDLSGKTVVPFNTNAGYGIGSSFRTVKEMASGAQYWKAFQPPRIERDGIYFVMEGERMVKADAEVKKCCKKSNSLNRKFTATIWRYKIWKVQIKIKQIKELTGVMHLRQGLF